MPSEDTKILKFDQYGKSYKTTLIIYDDLESLIKKVDGYRKNIKKSSTTKLAEQILVL